MRPARTNSFTDPSVELIYSHADARSVASTGTLRSMHTTPNSIPGAITGIQWTKRANGGKQMQPSTTNRNGLCAHVPDDRTPSFFAR